MMKRGQATPAELQLYPRARISETRARSILPFDSDRSAALKESRRLSVARFADRARALDADIRERETINAHHRWQAENRKNHEGETSACYLIPESNWHTAPYSPLNADFDDIRQTTAERLDRLAKAKLTSVETAQHLESLALDGERWGGRSTDSYARDLRTCGSCLHFHEVEELGESRLIAGSFCNRHLLCPFCAIRRAAKMLRRYSPLVVDVCRTRQLTPWLVTLTVKNGPDLPERFEHLRSAMRAMTKAAGNYRRWKQTGLQ